VSQSYGQKMVLSASTNGRPIAVTATTSGAADAVHTAASASDELDEVWLYASNPSETTERVLTVMFGGSSSSDEISDTIPPQRTRLVLAGVTIGGASGLDIKAFVSAELRLTGHVVRLVPAT